MDHESFLLVLSGPSGVGKNTVKERFLKIASGIWPSVSATTRPPRPGEKPGRDYIFVSQEQFEAMAREGELVEWVRVFGHYYGTPKIPLEEALKRGDVLLDIEVDGGLRVKELMGERAVLVFLFPPSWEELRARLTRRGTEEGAALEERLERARREMRVGAREYHYHVVNREPDQAARALLHILEAERHRRGRTRLPEGLVR